MTGAVRAFAPAKVNLFLHVGPPRPDGLHPLESLAAFADFGDEIVVAAADDLTLRIEGPFAAALEAEGTDNLALKAARALAEAARRRPAADIVLVKRLPIASGLGGGSSDGAAVLRALAGLWGLSADAAEVAAAARTLGADGPACLSARPVHMSGAGEVLVPMRLAPLFAVLVNPGVASPTGAVYRAFDASGGGGRFETEGPPDLSDPIPALAARRNDLEDAAIALVPAIAEALDLCRALPGARLARMSGSGATCFALFEDRAAAEAAALVARRERPAWWTVAVGLGGEAGAS